MTTRGRIEERRSSVTIEQAKADILARGFRVLDAACWEDENHVYAFSVEDCGPATYGHARCTAHYSKGSGWYTVDGAR